MNIDLDTGTESSKIVEYKIKNCTFNLKIFKSTNYNGFFHCIKEELKEVGFNLYGRGGDAECSRIRKMFNIKIGKMISFDEAKEVCEKLLGKGLIVLNREGDRFELPLPPGENNFKDCITLMTIQSRYVRVLSYEKKCKYCFQLYQEDHTKIECNFLKNSLRNSLKKKICKKTKQSINKKIFTYKSQDRKRLDEEGNITLEDVLELLQDQKNKCWVCQEEVLIFDYKPYCCYQFSLDRIDESLPHHWDNCKVSCFYCNSRYFTEFRQKFKVCRSGCHTVKKFLPDRRVLASEEMEKRSDSLDEYSGDSDYFSDCMNGRGFYSPRDRD